MDLYNSFKPVLLFAVFLIGAVRAVICFGKNEIKGMWIALGIAMVVFFFVSGPETTAKAGDGIMNAILNFISSIGSGGNA